MSKKFQKVNDDTGWLQLIREAKEMGLRHVEVRVLINKIKNRSRHTSS